MRKMAMEAEQLFQKYDVLMTPVLSHKTPKIGYFSALLPADEITKRAVDFASYTGLNNVTGSPAISLPLGTDSEGMPLGVHFSAPHGFDQRLIELAYELEAARPFRMMYDINA
jgi:amidase